MTGNELQDQRSTMTSVLWPAIHSYYALLTVCFRASETFGSVKFLKPKYHLGHPENYLFLLY